MSESRIGHCAAPSATACAGRNSVARLVLCLWIVGAASAPARAELAITNVQLARQQIAAPESATVRFKLDAPAHVTLNLYDGSDVLVRHVSSSGELAAGEHSLVWDGKDESGRAVPPEAYTFTLTARNGDSSVIWDIADATGGGDVTAQSVAWDAAARKIRYILPAPARVNIRVGLANDGPLLRTVIDWVPRAEGAHEESWDGLDASGVLALADHPELVVSVSAFKLPENSILIGPPPARAATIVDRSWTHAIRPSSRSGARKRMYAHSQQPFEERGDFTVSLALPAGLPRNAEGLPVVSRPIPVRLEIPDSDRARALARRFEPVFFLDGQFVFENEMGFVPMTWNWDPRTVNPGVHYLTVNLRGYEGNFGMATVKVAVEREERQ